MRQGRIISLLLVAVMAVGLLPNAALADGDRNIMRGVTGISGWNSATGYDYLYFGQWNGSSVKWRVLDDHPNTYDPKTNPNAEGLFLLSENALGDGSYYGGVMFDKTKNTWKESNAQRWCQNFYGKQFTGGEQEAVLATTKQDKDYTSPTYNVSFAGPGDENILYNDTVFFLSAEEAEKNTYGFTDDAARKANYNYNGIFKIESWWLRSPRAGTHDSAGYVGTDGSVSGRIVDNNWGTARPAFNLNLDSVLFTSAAAGGKSTAEASGKIIEIPTPETAPKEWKATIADEAHMRFAVTQVEKTEEKKYTVTYNGAVTTAINSNEWISVMIADATGAYTHYGRIVQPTGATGTVELDLTKITLPQNAKIYLFNEQCNDDPKTDYASLLRDLFPAAAGEGTAPSCGLTITQDPQDQTVEVGKRATFTVEAFGSGLTYQWYINRNDGLGWQKIDGATSDVYITSEVSLRNDGYLYFCEVTDAHGHSIQSDSAALYVVKTLIPPKTGDTGMPMLYLAAAILAGAGLIVLGKKDKRA